MSLTRILKLFVRKFDILVFFISKKRNINQYISLYTCVYIFLRYVFSILMFFILQLVTHVYFVTRHVFLFFFLQNSLWIARSTDTFVESTRQKLRTVGWKSRISIFPESTEIKHTRRCASTFIAVTVLALYSVSDAVRVSGITISRRGVTYPDVKAKRVKSYWVLCVFSINWEKPV